MVKHAWKAITPVPTSKDFVDLTLSKTQRKTPTEVHKQFHISRIRTFYMRKVKFTQGTYHERLSLILEQFPHLDDVHPFYADLINVLYDRDHYKVALSQVRNVRHTIDQIGREYVRLLKYGNSLYRCKCLKRAALGRMSTCMKKINSSLTYLEQVRQHLGRLPSIEPSSRTLLIAGFPNVGKSSFINKVTRADVEVQPYAFTTRALYVGHTDYKLSRFQVIDTPGILDHALENRNTIEMQSITALAHLNAAIMFFIDLSGTCGYTVAQQVRLYDQVKPLFADKPLFVVVNKCDLMPPAHAPEHDQALLRGMLQDGATLLQMSAATGDGVAEVKAAACEGLLAWRSARADAAAGKKVFLATPKFAPGREGAERPLGIPESVFEARRAEEEGEERPKRELETDRCLAAGGVGKYIPDERRNWILANEEWRYDRIPEIMDGMNIADFIDPEIEAKLAALEAEEARLLAEEEAEDRAFADDARGYAVSDMAHRAAEAARAQCRLEKVQSALKRTLSHRVVPLQVRARSNDFAKRVGGTGLSKARSFSRNVGAPAEERAVAESQMSRHRSASRKASVSPSRLGVASSAVAARQNELFRVQTRAQTRLGKQGIYDNKWLNPKPRHLFEGKVDTKGSRDRR